MHKCYYVYILTNKKRGVLYTGVTNNLMERTREHRTHLNQGFAEKYFTRHLVYYEIHQYINNAIVREKHIKHWKREWKIELIEWMNPEWKDLYDEITR